MTAKKPTYIKQRIAEPSTWAGMGLVAQSLAMLATSGWTSPTGWSGLLGGIGAVLMREKGDAGTAQH